MEPTEAVIVKDNVGCSVDRGNGAMEMSQTGKCTYNWHLHENTEKYIVWALNNGSLTPEGYRDRYQAEYGDIGAFLNMKDFDPIDAWKSENIVTNQGKNLTNDVMFGAVAKIATWYILIFNTNTTCVVGMTYGTPVFTESTGYSEATRPEYMDVPSASQIMTNIASRGVFTMTGTETIYGAGLVGGTNAATKGNTTASGNYLYSASLFAVPKSVVATNVLSVDISITQS